MASLPFSSLATSASIPSSFISTTKPRPSSCVREIASPSVGTPRALQVFKVQVFDFAFAAGRPVHSLIMHEDESAVFGEAHVHLDRSRLCISLLF